MAEAPVVDPTLSDDEVVMAYAENWVLSKVFEDMLKGPENDEMEAAGAAYEVNKSVALCLAQGVTGFGL